MLEERKREEYVCALCGRPATHFVVIPDTSRSYKYGECFRCEDHTDRVRQYFRKIIEVPIDEYLSRSKKKRRKGL